MLMERLVIVGVETTVKGFPVLSTPLACTITFPVVAAAGTVVLMLVALQFPEVTVALTPLNLTVLLPWDEPKFDPAIVTGTPTAPEDGVSVVMLGAATTVKELPALETPDTVTTILPLVAPVGTVVMIDVDAQFPVATVAVVPLNFSVLVP